MTVTDPVSPSSEERAKYVESNRWAIRPCLIYKDEYNECTSIKGRFHQYFIHGENQDCSQWKKDFENCIAFEDSDQTNIQAGEKIIKSEEQRRQARLKAHFANDTWTKRKSPPEDWSSPLPEWIVKKNENTYLDLKSKEMAGLAVPEIEKPSYFCSIM